MKLKKSKEKKVNKPKEPLHKRAKSVTQKVFHKELSKHVQGEPEPKSRQVPEKNLEEHRREIIQRGKKHLRPSTVSHQKSIVLSVVFGLITLTLLIISMGYLVFIKKTSNTIIYNVSKILPIKVAEIKDVNVQYDDVMFQFLTAKRAQQRLQSQGNQSDDQTLVDSIKKASLNNLVIRFAEQQGITVTKEEIEEEIAESGKVVGGIDVVREGAQSIFGWTDRELEEQTRIRLLLGRLTPQILISIRDGLLNGESFDVLTHAEEEQAEDETGEGQELDHVHTFTAVTFDDTDQQRSALPEVVIDSIDAVNTNEQVLEIFSDNNGHYLVYRSSEPDSQFKIVLVSSGEVSNELDELINGKSSDLFTCLKVGVDLNIETKSVFSCLKL
jgi:hypothetical protein